MGAAAPLPAGLQPRGLTREQAAVYCGCSTPGAFDRWVRDGLVPGPIPGTHRWDRLAIDRALDKLSGIESLGGEQLSPFEAWKRENEGRGERH